MSILKDCARHARLTGCALLVAALGACGGSGGGDDDVGSGNPQATPPDPSAVDLTNADRCSIVDSNYCLFPWPSDYYTREDSTTPTGRRVAIAQASLPTNQQGQPIDPAEWNRNDGFSPNQTLMTRVPGLDLARTGAVRITDLSDSLDADAPVMLLDAMTGERQLIWAELDASVENDADRALLIRPARQLAEGRRYIAVLRDLRNADGERLLASDAFRIYRDAVPTDRDGIEDRRPEMDALFETLEGHGVARDNLYLAWSFTTASRETNTERLLHIRDSAAASLGGQTPAFQVLETEDYQNSDSSADGFDTEIARVVRGTFTVPNFLNTDSGGPGSGFFYSDTPDDGLPDRMNAGVNTLSAEFTCRIPYAALSGQTVANAQAADVTPARPSLYGHGLLGSRSEVRAGNVDDMASTHNMMFCATDWIGFASADVPVAIQAFQNFSAMPPFFDRTQQGILNFEFLARALDANDGFASNSAFQVDGVSVFDNSEVFYDGNSQGGILGGAFMGITQIVKRGVLGVPGMNYSLLLRRSVDFAPFDAYFSGVAPGGDGLPAATGGYTNGLDRTFLLSFLQMLWDRAETSGYAAHIVDDTLPNTPSHEVLLHVAFGDHQVSMWSAELMARTIGARLRTPALVPGRHPDSNPFVELPAIENPQNYDGSAIVYWDNGPVRLNDTGDVVGGTAPPPITNTPPFEPEFGEDPHALPRADDNAQQQKSDFLKTDGTFNDTCADAPCTVDGYTP
ncbi:hypothetical protein SADO_15069 [Salinisphaera dokdonensis CL-ES53]|uniref:Lipoprotein n=1 Tax=Salinisphaera dokdonensis CL-ES53 TaxID=1304272 RepID=A0ABV2B4V8_9GAMM